MGPFPFHSLLQRLLVVTAALPLALLAESAAPAHAVVVTVTGPNGGTPGGAAPPATADAGHLIPNSDPSNTAEATGGNGGGGNGVTIRRCFFHCLPAPPATAGGAGGAATATATTSISSTTTAATAIATSAGGAGGAGGSNKVGGVGGTAIRRRPRQTLKVRPPRRRRRPAGEAGRTDLPRQR